MKRDFYSLGLIGYPLEHSLSPQIHKAALKALGLEGEYVLYDISPLPGGEGPGVRADAERGVTLRGLFSQMRAGAIHGLNVTIPHKQTVIPLLDTLTPSAKAIGAVNTIFLLDGQLVGDNTDAPGFWRDVAGLLGEGQPAPSALILGAGGAARAVAYSLLSHGYTVTVAARRVEQAQALCDQLSVVSDQLSVISYQFSVVSEQCSLVVNATPLGMHPHVEASPWPGGVPLPRNAAVYDLVYNPPETLLVRRAKSAGLVSTTGLGMLVEQAALAFERWTGLNAPRAEMTAAAKDDL